MRLLKPYYRCCFFLLIIGIATLSLSCTDGKKDPQSKLKVEVPTYSIAELDSTLPRLTVAATETFKLPEFSIPYYLEPILKEGYLVTNDRTNKAIHLFDKTGTHLGKAGEEGRGPGEFMGSITLHAGSDDHLYTYDSRLRRISRFKVERSGFSLVDTFSPSQESLTWLQNVYVTKWGNYAVYRERVDMATGEEEFHFYKLDDEFNQVERVLTLPGNEKMPLDDDGPFVQYIDHMAGKKTLWDLDREWFYYISSHSPVIHTYNLKTGESQTKMYFDLETRVVTEETHSQLTKYSANMSKSFPTVKDAMEKVQALPFFEEFEVHDQMLYLLLFDISRHDKTEIIRMNEKTGKMHYLSIPQRLRRIQAVKRKLYGIEMKDGDFSSIRTFNLEEL